MKHVVLPLFLLLAPAARADVTVTRDKTIVLAHVEVRGMLRDGDLRAFTGVNPQNQHWVAVEKLEGGGPAWQYWIYDATWGRAQIQVRDLRRVRLESFHRGLLVFSGLYENRDHVSCATDTRGQQWTTTCTGNGGPPPPPPAPPPPAPPPPAPWSAQPHVIRACGDVFDGPANETACMDAVRPFRFDPSRVIAQCDSTMDGDANELTCVRAASRAAFDPSAGLARCDNSMDGDANEQRCLETIAGARYDTSAAIDACDAAMDGDENELACIAVAARAGGDPSGTIRACDESMSGDQAELECVKRALGVR